MYEDQTYENILDRSLARVASDVDKREGSVIMNAIAPVSAEHADVYIQLGNIVNNGYADTAVREFLILRCKERGIIPYEATKATLKGKFNMEIPIGSRFNLNELNYVATAFMESADGYFYYQMECETEGTNGNKFFGELSSIEYIDKDLTGELTELLIPAEDEEDTEALRTRYLNSFDSNPFGGNKQDYVEKTDALDGVGGTVVIPVWNGGGTVKLIIINSDFGVASSTLVKAVQEAIDPDPQGTGSGIEQIERTLNNMFIEIADEYGIKRFEDMMGIYPEAGASLETRRFNVLVKWNDKVPYTEKELYNRLISICGDDNFSVNPDYKNYFLEIITHLGIEGAFDTISSILQDMIPCNLVLDLKNTLEEGNKTPFSVAVVSCVAMRYQITNDINPKVATESPMYYGVGLGRAGTHIITHDIKSTVNQSSDLNVAQALSTGGSSGAITMDIAVKDEIESPHYEGVGVGMAFTKIITHDINSKATNSGNTTVASPVNTATVITIN